ncbi:hypothetical protein [Mycobacterium paraterrae]|uniref:hypothetical protein n=1 Tax=Mycobacterium paraterrae TaxID=577492 RepID=UPI003D9CB782
MDFQKVALTVLAHFTPGPKVLDFPAPEVDWLDVRCANNVALTPHVTRSTVDTMRRYLVDALANCRRLPRRVTASPCGEPTHRLLAWVSPEPGIPRKATNADRNQS